MKTIQLSKSIFLLIFIGISVFSCGKKPKSIHPEYQPIVEAVYASATVKAVNQYELVSPVSGIVKNIFVKEGDDVIVGQVIAEIDNNQQLSIENATAARDAARQNLENIDELRAQIATAKNQFEQDSLNYRRQQQLWDRNVGTKNLLESKQLQYQASKNSLKALLVRYKYTKAQLETAAMQAETNLKLANELKNDFLVRSVVNGKVYNLNIVAGDLVGPQKILGIIGSTNDFILELEVDEVDIGKIKLGLEVLLEMDAFSNQVFEAKISRILPNLNTRSQTFIAEANFTKAPPTLFPGLSAEANIVIRRKERALVIPVQYLSEKSSILTQNGEKKVVTGLRSIGMIEIVSGLNSSDEILMPK